MSQHTLTARLAVVALAVVVSAPAVFGHGRAWWNVEYDEQVIVFPDTARHVTVVADLHTHTVFSDGHVWPNVRVAEALRDGLDAVAITDHLEYQPHRAFVPNPDRNAAVAEARMAAAGEDLLVIAGSEITRNPPAGHMNAVFVEDANALWPVGDRSGADLARFRGEWPAEDAVAAANAQGGFVFWNHPWGSPRTPDYRTELTELHETLIGRGQLHGIEIVNGVRYNEEAHRIALEHGLTFIGTSDVHNLVDWSYDLRRGGHRPVTLALAEERTPDGLRDALLEGRTVIWFEELLIGRPEHVGELLEAVLTLGAVVRDTGAEIVRATLENASSAVLRLRHLSTAAQSFHGAADLVNVEPQGRTELVLKPAEAADEVVLEFEVLNAITSPNTHPRVVLRAPVEAPPGPMSFRHEGSPAFTIEFPAGTREVAPDAPNQVFAASTPDGVTFQASVTDFPAGILLPIEKAAEYFVQLTTAAGVGSDFAVARNEEITLSDGSPAYRSEVTWLYLPAAVTLETQIVSAYRGGRLVSVTAHPRQSMEHISKLVESLRFP